METINPNHTTESLNNLLLAHDIKPTSQRLEVARLLFTHHKHFAAEEIFSMVNYRTNSSQNSTSRHNVRQNSVSKATVYNTLGLFARKGLVREVIADPNKVFYDPNTRPHYHMYDPSSGELTDISADSVQISGLPAAPSGREVEGVDIVVRLRPLK